MAKFEGIKCDSCGAVVDKKDSTEKLIRFKGPKVSGQYTEDLCPDCTVVPPGVTLEPWPKMKPDKADVIDASV